MAKEPRSPRKSSAKAPKAASPKDDNLNPDGSQKGIDASKDPGTKAASPGAAEGADAAGIASAQKGKEAGEQNVVEKPQAAIQAVTTPLPPDGEQLRQQQEANRPAAPGFPKAGESAPDSPQAIPSPTSPPWPASQRSETPPAGANDAASNPSGKPSGVDVDTTARAAKDKADRTNKKKITIDGEGSVPIFVDGAMTRFERGKPIEADAKQIDALKAAGEKIK